MTSACGSRAGGCVATTVGDIRSVAYLTCVIFGPGTGGQPETKQETPR